jgi:CubicO group peptidase (beta-lactamase class C family)
MATHPELDRLLEGACVDVPGVVALVTSPTQVLYAGAFGRRNVKGDAAMTLDTIFSIASMTKPLVSAGVLQLVERGLLDLDEPIGSILPQLSEPAVLEGFDEHGLPRLRQAASCATIRQLLTHTSGYAYGFWSEHLHELQQQRGEHVVPANWDQLVGTPLLFDPGTQWAYGIGTDVLGKAIEAVSNQPLDEFLVDNVLGAMGMNDTTVTLSVEQRTRAADIHSRGDGGALIALDGPIDGGRTFCMGGGALCSTGPDYVRFLQMILQGGNCNGTEVLNASSIALMATNQIGSLEVTPLQSVIPSSSNDVDLLPGTPLTWGCGFQINTEPTPGGRGAGSLSWAGLFNTYFWIDPAAGLAGVLLTAILPFADTVALPLFGSFERAAYSAFG